MARASTFPELFFRQVDSLKDRVALRRKEMGIWKRISWSEYGTGVREVAAGLLALGLHPGDKVAILGDNRPEWLFSDLGTMTIGGVSCGVYPTSAPEQVAYIVGHSESKVLFVENEEQVDKALQILPDLDLKQVVIWDPKGLWGFTHEKIVFFDDFLELGREYLRNNPDAVVSRLKTVKPDDIAMIIYTSGTTGRPKAAMISHSNILEMTRSFLAASPSVGPEESISYLPMAHIYENLISLFQAVWMGGTVNFVESLDTLPQNLREVSPTVFASVPRIWEKFASAISIRMSDSTPLKRLLYGVAINVGLRYVKAPEQSWDRRKWAVLYWPLYLLVLTHLKRQLGMERVRWAICGAAPASPGAFRIL